MKSFSHSGHLGDILYSLPAVKILSGGEAVIHIKEVFEDHRGHINGNCGQELVAYTQYDALRDLLLSQSYIKEVHKYIPPPGVDYSPGLWPGLKVDYDLDKSRHQRQKAWIFHVKRYFDAFGITEDWRNHVPWLEVDNGRFYRYVELLDGTVRQENYAIFHVTDRWHGFVPDWKRIYQNELRKYDRIYFTGYKHDYDKFEARYSTMMDYLPTETLLDLARVIRDAQVVYCNQNCSLVISQGLGKKYYLAKNADRTHAITNLENENIL